MSLKYLHKYKVKGEDYFVIRYKNKYIAGRKNKEEILQIHQECEEANWDYGKVFEIKRKYKKYKPHGDKTKYIYKNQYGVYAIYKDKKFYISSKDKEEIIRLRDLLMENNWDMECLPKTFKRRNRTQNRDLPKYIYRTPYNTYQIHKDGKSYGTFKRVEDAKVERDLLIEYGWTYDYIDLY